MSPRSLNQRLKASLLAAGAASTITACQDPQLPTPVFDSTTSQAKTELLQNTPVQSQISKSAQVRQIGEVYLDRLSAVGIKEGTAKTIAIQQALATVKHLEAKGEEVNYTTYQNLHTNPELAQTLADIERRFAPEATRLAQHTEEYFGNPNRNEAKKQRQAWTAQDIAKGWKVQPAPEANFERDAFARYFPGEPLRAPEIPTTPPARSTPQTTAQETGQSSSSFPWNNVLKITGLAALGGAVFAARKKITNAWKNFRNGRSQSEKNSSLSQKEQAKLKSRANYLHQEILKDRNQEFSVFLAQHFPGFDPLQEILNIKQTIAAKDASATKSLDSLVTRYNDVHQTYTREWNPKKLISKEITQKNQAKQTTQASIFETAPKKSQLITSVELENQVDSKQNPDNSQTSTQPLPQIAFSKTSDVSYLANQTQKHKEETDQTPTNPWEGPLVTIPQADNGEGKSYQIPEVFQDRVPDPNKVQESRKWLVENMLVSKIDLFKGREVLPNNGSLQDKQWRQELSQAEIMYRGDLNADFKQLLSDLLLAEVIYIDAQKLSEIVKMLEEYKLELEKKVTSDYLKRLEKDLAKPGYSHSHYQMTQQCINREKQKPQFDPKATLKCREKIINFIEQEIKYIPNKKVFKMAGDIINDDKGLLMDDGLTLRVFRSLRRQAKEMNLPDPFTVVASNHDIFTIAIDPKFGFNKYDHTSKETPESLGDTELAKMYFEYLQQTILFDYDLETNTLLSHTLPVNKPNPDNTTISKYGTYETINFMLTQFGYSNIQTQAELEEFVTEVNTWYQQTIREIIQTLRNSSESVNQTLIKKIHLIGKTIESRHNTQNPEDLFFTNIVKHYVVGHDRDFGDWNVWNLGRPDYDPTAKNILANLERHAYALYITK